MEPLFNFGYCILIDRSMSYTITENYWGLSIMSTVYFHIIVPLLHCNIKWCHSLLFWIGLLIDLMPLYLSIHGNLLGIIDWPRLLQCNSLGCHPRIMALWMMGYCHGEKFIQVTSIDSNILEYDKGFKFYNFNKLW